MSVISSSGNYRAPAAGAGTEAGTFGIGSRNSWAASAVRVRMPSAITLGFSAVSARI